MPDQETARLIADQSRRILAIENRIAALESRLPADMREATKQLTRCADIAERQLAAINQLGRLLSCAEQFQATLSTPNSPWVPT